MTETFGSSGAPVGGTSPSMTTDGGSSTRDVAKGEAKGVAQDAVQGGKQTAETARQQAGQVAGETKDQARALLDQTREELASQGSVQQQRAATGLRSVADEITGMVNGQGGAGGMASDLARQLSDRVQTAADWLETREPRDLLDEVQRFARRRPGTFLAAAGILGFIGGRATRGAVDEARDSHDTSTRGATGYQGSYADTGTGVVGSYADTDVSDSLRSGTGTATGASFDYAEPAGSAGLASTSESVSRTAPHGDATATFSPTAPLTATGDSASESALIEDPAGEDRFGGRSGKDPI